MAQYSEGQMLRGSDGNTYVVRGGVPVLASSAVPVTGGDPRLPFQVQAAQGQAAAAPYQAPKARADATAAQADATIKVNQAANAQAVAQADRDKAIADAQRAQYELQKLKLGGQLDPEKRKAIEALQQQLDRVNVLYQGNLKGGLPNVLNNVVPDFLQPGKAQFDSAAQGMVNPFQAAFRIPGVGAQSDTELKQFLAANVPNAGEPDQKIEEQLRNLQTRIDTELGTTRSNALPPVTAPAQDQVNFATGKTRDQIDPILKATGDKVGAMLSSGVPDGKIRDFLLKSGVNPSDTNVEQALKFRRTDDFKRWQRANPGQSYPIGSDFYTKQVPMSATRTLLNKAAASDVGGSAMAAGAAATNAVTGGYLNDLTADPAAAQTGMNLLRGQHPVSSLVGDVAGQAALEGMAGGIPGVGPLLATRLGRRAADLGYGAFSGSGESDDGRGVGAIEGGLGGVAFGAAGRGLQRGIGAAATGVRNADLSYLNKAGIPLTIGRIARGAGDFNPLNPATVGDEVGKGVAGLEDRFAGFPGLDAVIGTARQRGDQAFNQATFREIAPGVVGTGAAGLTSAKAAENAAYAKLGPVRLAVDQPFTDALDNLSAATHGLRHHAGDVQTVIGDIRDQISNGEMTGKGYQTAMQAIRKTRATLNDDVGGKAASALDALEQQVADLGSRQGGQVAQDLAEANAIHARRQIVKTALKGSVAQGADEMFSPKTLNQAAIRNTEKFGGLDRALSPDRQFYNLTTAGMKAMPNLTPDSGTAGRLLLYPLIAGAGGSAIGAATDEDRGGGAERGAGVGTGLALLALGAGAGPYSRTGQRIIQKALLGERPRNIQRLGDFLINSNPKYAGMFGSSLGRDFFFQPELPQ